MFMAIFCDALDRWERWKVKMVRVEGNAIVSVYACLLTRLSWIANIVQIPTDKADQNQEEN